MSDSPYIHSPHNPPKSGSRLQNMGAFLRLKPNVISEATGLPFIPLSPAHGLLNKDVQQPKRPMLVRQSFIYLQLQHVTIEFLDRTTA